MKHSVLSVRMALVLGVAYAGLAAPSFAMEIDHSATKMKREMQQIGNRIKQRPGTGHPEMVGKPMHPPLVQNHDEPEFGEAVAKPYVEDMQGMLQAMQSVKTRADAIAFQKKFGEVMPNVEKNLRRVRHSMGRAAEKGIKTPDMAKGEALLQEVEKRGDQIEQHMQRIEKLNPNMKVMFKKFNDIHED